jgi:phosphate transport system substrate-binding protein
MKRLKLIFSIFFISSIFFLAYLPFAEAENRDKIRIVGSSAVLPIVLTVAENFTETTENPSPALELTGTGRGFRLFCSGVGYETPDINATPRPIARSEFRNCIENGVNKVTEIIVGLDALVLVNSKNAPPIDLTVSQLFSSLAEMVEKDGKIVENPYEIWNHISSSLPDTQIKVMGPPPLSALHDDFLELIMESGCQSFPLTAALQGIRRFEVCNALRSKPYYTEGLKNESMIIEWLQDNTDAFAIVPFSVLQQNNDALKGNLISGIAPTIDNIVKGNYALTRPIYLYVKTKHVGEIKGLQKFLYEFTSERAIGPEGYLIDKGFIPLDDRGRNAARDMALSLTTIKDGKNR